MRWLVVIGMMFVVAFSAAAQTETPTPTPTATVTNRDFSPAPSISTVSVTTRTNAPHVRRINTLLAAEPDLQEIPTGLCAPSDSR